ncbi:MAG: TIGR04211 family SH3 domain-containing protein [Proteobacteria bacterium]|nr:TIGR04211 family SH3 domain-containing protein [Pseudomonadota bacterium]MCZ6781678.1 TIGR04211 family SH3 domain-containing protein [Pseudomonadota bacterium]
MGNRTTRTLRALVLAIALAALWANAAGAEYAWVRGEVRLNLRTGPGTQFRIVGVMKTGDGVTILKRAESWTQVRLGDGKEGWIPVGYLQAEPPPSLRLEQLEAQTVDLQQKLETTSAEAAQLRETNASLSGRDVEQQSEIGRLSLENLELKAGARWPEWITGGSILLVGMMVGALLHRNATRRPSSRLRI